jgi:hypothetical protein
MDYEFVEQEVRRILSSSTEEGYKLWTVFECEYGDLEVFFSLVKMAQLESGAWIVTDMRFVDCRGWVLELTNNRPVILNHKILHPEYLIEIPPGLAPLFFYRIASLAEDTLPEKLNQRYFAEYIQAQSLPKDVQFEVLASLRAKYW